MGIIPTFADVQLYPQVLWLQKKVVDLALAKAQIHNQLTFKVLVGQNKSS